MPWKLLKITVDKPLAEALSEALSEAGALSVTLEDAEDEPILELPPDTVIFWSRCKLTGLFEHSVDLPPLVLELEHLLNSPLESQVTDLPDEDWERVCLDQFKPMCFGERLWICPSWCLETTDRHCEGTPEAIQDRSGLLREYPRNDGKSTPVIVTLDPGLAFGTGSHATTRLMLQWLDGADLTGKTVIDYGCGSGILAIAAAKLGATRVIGIDYDPQALVATGNNAEENGLKDFIEVYAPAACPEVKADIILANIIVNPLIELMPVFVSHLKSGGALILSGLLQDQESLLLSHLPPSLKHLKTVQSEEWLRIDLMMGE